MFFHHEDTEDTEFFSFSPLRPVPPETRPVCPHCDTPLAPRLPQQPLRPNLVTPRPAALWFSWWSWNGRFQWAHLDQCFSDSGERVRVNH